VLAAMKVRGLSFYGAPPPGDERRTHTHAAEVRRHRGVGSGGNLRAAVFGVNDGLVSNASLIFGVAGATGESGVVLLTGVAGLLAGAFSMAAGEYVSVRSQRELFEFQIALERAELEEYPEEEAAELAIIYQGRGLPRAEAERLADRVISDPATALDALAREELGLVPEQLGSPWGAAAASFLAFATGAALPLLPFLVFSGHRGAALLATIALTAAALFTVGAALSLFTGRGAVAGGLRMLAIGAAAGAATWCIGALLGVAAG
jgi:VIT1/CCC1 family predicted Fe2+/Mn2+ transporter